MSTKLKILALQALLTEMTKKEQDRQEKVCFHVYIPFKFFSQSIRQAS